MGMRARLPVALLCLALAGCTAAPTSPQVATAASLTASAATASAAAAAAAQSPSPKLTDYDKALAYTRCMTENGAPTPDPVVGEPLVTVNTIQKGDTWEALDAKRTAFTKCKQLLPNTWPLKMDPKEEVRIQKFVACVRKRGIDWPVTGADGMAPWPTDPGAMGTPAYDAAVQACRHLVDDPAANLARPAGIARPWSMLRRGRGAISSGQRNLLPENQ